jgi:hypothetical protein
MPFFMKISSRCAYLSEDGSIALKLSRGFVIAAFLFSYSIYCIDFEKLRFYTLMVSFSGFPWSCYTFYSRTIWDYGTYLSERRSFYSRTIW